MARKKGEKVYTFTCGDLELVVGVQVGEFPKANLLVNWGPWHYRTSATATPGLTTNLVPRLFKAILDQHPELIKASDLDQGEPVLLRVR